MDRLIGSEIPRETVKNILASLDIKLNSVTDGGVGLTIPAYRVDVTREADVIEEILRVYGYNNIDFSHKLNTSISFSENNDLKLENAITNQLVSLGFNETMSNSLTKADYSNQLERVNSKHNVSILNPLSADLGVMRQSLLFSGLESVLFNINRKNSALKFFEFGKSYHRYESGYQENKHLTLFVTGDRNKESWNTASKPTDFFYIKGVVSALLSKLGIDDCKTSPTKEDLFSEGISFSLGKMKLVDFGVVKKSILKKAGIKQAVYYADFNWDQLLKVGGKTKMTLKELPKFPSVKRDFALLLDENVSFKDIYNLAFQTERKLLTGVDLFDVYEGSKLGEGKKSYAVSFVLQDQNKTLNEKQIDKIMQKLQQNFEKNLNASLR
jgi:phenylalanyl-tRNA synthetase beta chain